MLTQHRSFRFILLGGLLPATLMSLPGCGGAATDPPAGKAEHRDGHGHDHGRAHAETGPHQGQLIELGDEEYHAELLHDDATHRITIYLLDGKAEKCVPLAEAELTLNLVVAGKPTQFRLPAAPQADDPTGRSSRFEAVDPKLCEALDDKQTKGRLNVTIAGKPFAGEIAPHEHD